jgi:PAS domain S-box-containing protein
MNTFKELGVATEELQVAVEELRRQNEQLSEALELVAAERKRYQDLFQSAPQAYLVTSLQGTIQEANRMAAQLLGVPTQFLVGKSLLPFISESDRSTYWNELMRRQQRDYFQEWEFRLCPRQQETIQVACSVVAIYERSNQPIGFRWVLRDITEQKRLQVLEQVKYDLNDDSDAALLQNRSLQEFNQGELIPLNPKVLYYLTQGLVKLTTFTTQNKEMLIGVVRPGTPFGAYLTALPIYQAIALSNVKAVPISLNEVASSPYLGQLMLARTTQRLRQTEMLLTIQGEQSVESSLSQLLELLAAEIGESMEQGIRLSVRLTHEDLASACGSTRATITRLLGKLERKGKIMLDDKRHIILVT